MGPDTSSPNDAGSLWPISEPLAQMDGMPDSDAMPESGEVVLYAEALSSLHVHLRPESAGQDETD